MVLHRHAGGVHIGGEQGLQVHVHLTGGLHLHAVGVLKVDVHGQHAVVAVHRAGGQQVGLRLGVVLAALLVQLRRQHRPLGHVAVGVVHPDGHGAAVGQGQLRRVVGLALHHVVDRESARSALVIGHGDGGQNQHVGGDEHHRRRHAGAGPVPPLAADTGAKQLSRPG